MAGTAVAVAAVLGLLLAVRALQGEPPATSWAELEVGPREPVMALAGSGDLLHTVEPGETFWSIAKGLAPGGDPRPVVDRLVAANGGASSLLAGQPIVIPADLLGG